MLLKKVATTLPRAVPSGFFFTPASALALGLELVLELVLPRALELVQASALELVLPLGLVLEPIEMEIVVVVGRIKIINYVEQASWQVGKASDSTRDGGGGSGMGSGVLVN